MSKSRSKQEIVTFKVDESLLARLQGIENRSEFIRSALLQALDHGCPLCKGTGVLSPKQQEHWEVFSQAHPLRECEDCHEVHLTCEAGEGV
jgi:hypothetical protein